MSTSTNDDVPLAFNLAYYPDRSLTRRTELVTDFSDMPQIVDAMFYTMLVHNGIGLSANQCKLPYRLFVMRTANLRRAFINPECLIAEHSCIKENDEQCLSFPGLVANVSRQSDILVIAYDVHGNRTYTHMSGLEAICAQHEIEHLEGKTFIDSRSRIKKLIAERTVKKVLKDPECLKQPKRL